MVNKLKCSNCKQLLPVSNFHKENISKRGYQSRCKECNKKLRKERWDKVLETEYKRRRTPRGLYSVLKGSNGQRRKTNYEKHKVLFTVDEFLIWYDKQKKECFYCGIPEQLMLQLPQFSRLNYSCRTYRFSVDRKNSERPYELDNIVLCCMLCNVTKRDNFTSDEFIQLAQQYIKPKWINL